MGWEDAPIVQAAPKREAWEDAPIAYSATRNANGIVDAFWAGAQNSATGMVIRGKLPDVQLDPQHSKWYERLVAGGTQLAADLPEMVVGGLGGAVAGGAAGSALPGVGTAAGAAVGGGAGAFALPAAIRESYIQALSKGEITDSADFLNRAAIVLKHTGKEALIGGLTAGAGKAAGLGAQAAGFGAKATAATTLGAEYGTLVVAPAALEGRLPEPQDFLDTAVLLLGLKAAGHGASKLQEVYKRTGKTPTEVLTDAKSDPTIVEDLAKGTPAEGTVYRGVTKPWDESARNDIEWWAPTQEHASKYGTGGEVVSSRPDTSKYLTIKESDYNAESLNAAYTRSELEGIRVVDDVGNTVMLASFNKPEVSKSARPTEPEIPRAYQELARDENARSAVPEPSPEAAKFVEKPFADVPQMPGEPVLPTHVNYNYLNTAEDVKGALSRLSGLYEQKIQEATRGTVPWEQTYAEAKALFEKETGSKAPDAPTDANYRKLSADLYAQKQLLMSGAEQLMALRNDYVEARKNGTATDDMKLQLLAQVDRVAAAQATTRGAQAEVGRALNILKSTNRDKAYYDELNKVLDDRFAVDGKLGGANFDKMIDMMGELGSPKEALDFAAKAAKATTWDKVVEAWKSGLVSGPFTQVANVMGNATFMATRPLVDTVAAAVSAVRSGPDRMSAVEPLARIIGNIHGTIDGAKTAWSVLKNDGLGDKGEARRNAIEGLTGEIVRSPFRLLSSADAFFRVTNERGEAYSLATREATKEGFNPATREFRDRVIEIAQNPTEKMQEAIDAAGTRFTFNTPLGEKGQTIQAGIRKLHLEWAVPFVQTPANVYKEMMRLTPAAPIVKEWREAFAEGGAARDKAVAEMVVGTAVFTTVFSFAVSGNISGQGDPDPKKRAVAMAAGWQPYSIKVGDTWYNYQRLQPVGTLMGMAADIADAWEHLTPDESDKIVKILSTGFANAITNQTFLQGITQVVNALSDPTRFFPKMAQGMAASTVPALVGQTAQMMDPYQREVDSIKDAVQSRIPGLREDLFPKRDAYGEKVEAKDRMGGISPIITSTESADKVKQEARRLGIGVAKAPDHIQLPSGKDDKLGRISLTPEQQDIWATEQGHMAHQILGQLVGSPTWDALPDMAQKNAMNMVFERTRLVGQAAAVKPEQIQREAQRIATELKKRLEPQ